MENCQVAGCVLINWMDMVKSPLLELYRLISLLVMCGGTCFSNALATWCIRSIFVFANLAGDFHIALLTISLLWKEASFPYLFAIYFSLPVKCLFIIIARFFLWVVNHFIIHKSSHLLTKYALFWSYVLQMFFPVYHLPLISHTVA